MKGMMTHCFTVCGGSWTRALPNIWTPVSASGGEKCRVGSNYVSLLARVTSSPSPSSPSLLSPPLSALGITPLQKSERSGSSSLQPKPPASGDPHLSGILHSYRL